MPPVQRQSIFPKPPALPIERLLTGEQGGEQQIASRIAYNEIDVLLYFRDTAPSAYSESDNELQRMCDMYNIPVATNIATAEVLIMALDRGDRIGAISSTPPEYNRKRKKRA